MLTITIPTYNRNERLNKSLRLLLPQLQHDPTFYKLLFLDNCSPVPIAETLPEVLDSFPDIPYQIIRNKQNIGANANIMRCFELCETEWIWCLSDDDPVLPTAVATIRQTLLDYPDYDYYNFPYADHRKHTYVTTGIEDFINQLDTSANLPWISSSFHRTANMQANLKYGYQFAYSMLPHVATLLMSLGTQGKCCMSSMLIMAENLDPTPFEHNWSIVSFAIGAPVIYDIPLPYATRQVLAKRLLVTHFGESINLRSIVIQLLLVYFTGKEGTDRFDHGNLMYNFNQIVGRNYYLRNHFGRLGLKLAYYRLMVRFPRLTAKVLNLLGNPMLQNAIRQDRFERI